MIVKLRYATKRINRRGDVRWYWQRPGHPLTRLPDDLAGRVRVLTQLNAAVDSQRRPQIETEHGTIGWVIQKYRASDDFLNLAVNSKKTYKRFIADVEKLGTTLPFSSFTRRAVVDFIGTYPRPSQRRMASTVMKVLTRVALYQGLIETDPTTNLRLRSQPPRDRLWTDEEKARWLASAAATPYMVTAFRLLEFTAQRPVDVLKMAWPHVSDGEISVTQKKTGARLVVPMHPVLRDHLAGMSRRSMMVVADRGRPVSYYKFNRQFRRICQLAGIDAEARDLRRTAMVNMALAGANTPMIASVSGHSIDHCQRILDVYLPRGRELAQAAITKLVEYKKETGV